MAVLIRPDIYWIGVNDRTTDLFEGLWPVQQEGISYNSYLIDDEKKAVIDLSKDVTADEFVGQLSEQLDLSQLDYAVINHMEPDHSGAVPALRRLAPGVTFVGSKKTAAMLESFYGIRDGVQIVSEGDTLSLGKHTLRFFSTPSVHWPETMMTFETSQGILFSGDGFGGYGALDGGIFDDDCRNFEFYLREVTRYYANILPLYSTPVLKALAKLREVSISVVAPSHGLVWRSRPRLIIELYEELAGYAAACPEPGVALVYGSMYGNTRQMMESVARGIRSEGLPLQVFDAGRTHISYMLPALWTQRGVMVGAPTYDAAMFPPVAQLLEMADHKRIRGRRTAYFGSYGWNGGARRHFKRLIEPLKWKLMENFEFVGAPSIEDLTKGEQFGAEFGRFVREQGQTD